MLQAIREKLSGWILFLIIGILIVPFAFLGIGDYFSAAVPTYAAKVGEDEISTERVREALTRQRQQYRAAFGEGMNLDFLSTPEAKRTLLDQLIDQTLLYQDSQRAGIVVPPERIQEETRSIEAFQVAGQFDPEQYARVLAANQMTPRGFQVEQARDIATREISSHVAASVGVSDAEVNAYLRLRDQRRSFAHVLLQAINETIDENVDEAAIAAHYEANKNDYMLPERMRVDYVEVRAEALTEGVDPTEDELRRMYEDQSSRFVQPARALTSHILVAVPAGADADAERQALEKANGLRQRIVEGGESFDAVARESSEDPGSAPQGGDLGWVEPGFNDEAFDEALFALEAGAISEPVRGSFGYHIIQAREVEAERGKAFEEVSEELRTEWMADARYRAFNERAGELLSAVNASPRSLQSAAAKVGLSVQQSELFSQSAGTGLFADPRLREAAFAGTVKDRGVVSEPVQLAEEHVVVLQRNELVAAEPQPLDEVREQVRSRILDERRAAALEQKRQQLQARIDQGETLQAIAADLGSEPVSADQVLRNDPAFDTRVLQEAFKLARPQAAPRLALLSLSPQELLLLRLDSVTDGDPGSVDTATRAQVREQLQRHWSASEAAGYLEFLRARADIEVVESRLP